MLRTASALVWSTLTGTSILLLIPCRRDRSKPSLRETIGGCRDPSCTVRPADADRPCFAPELHTERYQDIMERQNPVEVEGRFVRKTDVLESSTAIQADQLIHLLRPVVSRSVLHKFQLRLCIIGCKAHPLERSLPVSLTSVSKGRRALCTKMI